VTAGVDGSPGYRHSEAVELAEAQLDALKEAAANEKHGGLGVLLSCLDAAVPLHMWTLSRMSPWRRDETRTAWLASATDLVASHGDSLMYRTAPNKNEPHAAQVFNALAKALAAAAYRPGGVTVWGRHWEPSEATP
jgi:hypothetical protein